MGEQGTLSDFNGSCDRVLSVQLPVEKLNLSNVEREKVQVALVATGSFNPPTFMHLRMFELARDTLVSRGFHMLGGYMSPVNDAYGKPGLVSSEHRIRMCQLAAEGSQFIMVDAWEALQPSYQRTLTVLARVANALHCLESVDDGSIRVMLLCGADLLESMTIPGIWLPDQLQTIFQDYGLVCILRGGRDMGMLISEDSILSQYKENIFVVDDFDSDISSTRVRKNLAEGISVEHLTPANVISYIKANDLYSSDIHQAELA